MADDFLIVFGHIVEKLLQQFGARNKLTYTVTTHRSIAEFNQKEWNTLAVQAGPFLSFEFLSAMENSGSVDNKSQMDTGWTPCHLSVRNHNGVLIAVVPGYLKHHSYGEYVFDHSWANAYAHHGLNYYPKWIAAIPFTPVTGPRFLALQEFREQALEAVNEYLHTFMDASSIHWLFNSVADQKALQKHKFLSRYSVQFQWHNRQYADFDDFLGSFKSRKRKDIRKERRKAQQGLTIKRLTGEAITGEAKALFYLCYQRTYLKRSGHNGYLTAAFFEEIFETMSSNIMLVLAYEGDNGVAASLFFYDDTGLYGRYWGALQEIDGLHFECCYYQGIEFAIENALPLFNPGTQGEHKLLRGFEPTLCASAHLLKDPRFHTAVNDFLQREAPAIAEYYQQTEQALPFNEETRHGISLTRLQHTIN